MHITAAALTRLVVALFEHAGAEPANALACAAHLVEANLKGHDSHGVALAPVYVRWMASGRIFPNRHAEMIQDRGAVVVMQGGYGLGQVVGHEAMAVAVARARSAGIACVALRNAGHLGRIGAYGEHCADAGLVSMHYVNVVGHAPTVAPFGGRVPMMVTNPYCCVVPRPEGAHVVVDFATSAVAIGKARGAHVRGEQMPAGTLVDAGGQATTDPGVLFTDGPRGHLLPFGMHKGGGLLVLCELLGGALAGHATSQSASHRGYGATVNNMLSIVIDPNAFGGRDRFEHEATALIAALRQTPPAAGVTQVQVPGDPERAATAERQSGGVALDDQVRASLLKAAAHAGLDRSFTQPLTSV